MMHIDQKWRNRFSKGTYYASFIFFAFSFSYIAFATPPASPYTPGATLNPGCTPGSANCTVSVLPSGSTGEVQFNLSGAFAGSPSFFWDNTNKRLGIGTTSPSAKLEINGTTTPTGVELVTNGTFTGSATGWTLGGDAVYASNAITVTNTTDEAYLGTAIAIETGKTYLLTFTLSSVSGDTVVYYFDNNGESLDSGPFGNGIHTVAFSSNFTGTDTIWFGTQDSYIGGTWIIDNVSIKEMPAVSPALKVIGFNGDTALSLGGDILGNTAIGLSALASNTTGSRNTANGVRALFSNITSSNNTANGYQTLFSNTTGSYNTATGVYALQLNTTGFTNTATGAFTLFSNITGNQNTASGVGALYFNTTGSNNTASGAYALQSNTAGYGNTASGVGALEINTTGYSNSAQGYLALNSNTTGNYNSAQGVNAGRYITDGATANQTSNNSLYLGYDTRALASGDTNEIVIGASAIGLGSNTAVLGNSSITTTALRGKVGIGTTSPYAKLSIHANNGETNTTLFSIASSTASATTTLFTVTNEGGVGIGTTSPWRKFSVTGTVGFDGLTGAIGAGSLCLDANKQVVYNSGTDACLSSTRATKHDIENLSFDALAVIGALNPVSFVYNEGNGRIRYGFIAEDTAAVLSSLATYDDSSAISGIDDRAVLAVAVKAIQEQEIKISDIETLVGTSGSQSFAERVVSALTSFGVEIADTFVRVKKLIVRDEICINATCINEEQLKTLLENAGFSGTTVEQPVTEQPPTEPDLVVDTESPTITLVGNNPAIIQTGDTYADLGATVSDNMNQNLGYTISVDGGTPTDPSALSLDTSTPITYTLTFTATDQAGNVGTTARTIIVEDPSSLPI